MKIKSKMRFYFIIMVFCPMAHTIGQSAHAQSRDSVNESKVSASETNAAIGNHLADLYMNKKTPTDDDMQLVIAALQDDRTSEWTYLSLFIELWHYKRGEVPEEFIHELANMVLRKKNIGAGALAIFSLPNGAAKSIYPKLKQITQDKDLRDRAYSAVIRLGDAGPKAVPEYIKILEEYKMALDHRSYNIGTQKVMEIGNAPRGAIIGLCRLGGDALPAKNILFSLVGVRPSAKNALIQMGLTEELKQMYESNEKLWKEIQRAIGKKERADKKGKRFCGK